MPHSAHKPPRSKVQQDLLLGALVGVSMLVIVGIYALTLRYQDVGIHAEDAPRWSVLAEGVITRVAPLKTVMRDVSDKIASITKAHTAQNEAVILLKAKLEAATGTQQTMHATATSETETP